MKKILVSLSAVALAVASVPMFAAFEAHVINVTARIENALQVDTTPIQYGTVFPQEKLDKVFRLSLSNSFQTEPDADDVNYIIRQKPKCQIDVPGAEKPEFVPVSGEIEGRFICPDGYHQLLLLCPYLSKHEVTADGTGENDSAGINAFHGPISGWVLSDTVATQVSGRLAKSDHDLDDAWNIDFRVPCFKDHCAQDWADFVKTQSGNPLIDPSAYIQPGENEHKLFGCDLWVEVTGVSRFSDPKAGPEPTPTPTP